MTKKTERQHMKIRMKNIWDYFYDNLTHHADILRRRVEHHRREMHGRASEMDTFLPRFRFRLNFLPGWVWFQEELTGGLPERLDLLLHCLPHHWVTLLVKIHRPLIRQIVEHVGRSHSFRTFLLVAKYQVDPLVKLAGDKLGLESLSVYPDKLLGAVCPRRQLHIAHFRPVVELTESVAGAVDEHLGQVVELRDQLLHIARVSLAV